jgi:RimJ/RimL family protein N-acetyltransferase
MSANARPPEGSGPLAGGPDPGAAAPWIEIDLPWRGTDRAGAPLELREAELNDAAAWIQHLSRITTETPWMLQSQEDPLPSTLEQRTLLEEYGGREGSLAVVAVRPGSREILGTLTLASGRSRRTEHAAELSMGVGRAWWGRGVGALLMGAGLTWASHNHILRRVSLSVFHDNEVARRLYERVGFSTEGVLRRYVRIAEGHEDLVVMGLWFGGEL